LRQVTLLFGVFAPNSAFRKVVVPGSANPAHKKRKKPAIPASAESAVDRDLPTAPLNWAERLRRVFDIDISVCPLCGGTLRVIADVTDPDVIQTILTYLKQRAPPAACAPANAGSRASKRSHCCFLMVDTTAARFSLRQQNTMLANRPSVGQPLTTSPVRV
jgi:hypothetical protein